MALPVAVINITKSIKSRSKKMVVRVTAQQMSQSDYPFSG